MTSKLILGDCIEVMKTLEANSIDAVVSDPPYGLEFMGKKWDSFDSNDGSSGPYTFQKFNRDWAIECFRVLKSGGFLFAMGGTRTHHQLTCGIEDAGFLIRDEIEWAYASGFPKAQDIGMMIEKKMGGEGEETGENNPNERPNCTKANTIYESGTVGKEVKIKIPTLPQAKEWQGWKTSQLKPAHEPIVIAQKPCEGSITENVMKYGVGGYNVDGCRIPYQNKSDFDACDTKQKSFHGAKTIGETTEGKTSFLSGDITTLAPEAESFDKGRFPPNLLVQDDVLNDGNISSSSSNAGGFRAAVNTFSEKNPEQERYTSIRGFDDEGQFSRYFSLDAWWSERIKHLPRDVQKVYPFFIVPKAAKGEKEEGLEEWEEGTAVKQFNEGMEGKIRSDGTIIKEIAKSKCTHPTVKPVSLMSYLITLATRENAVVLDPFMGSGTTGIAAHCLNRNFIGIEKNEEYFKIAQARIGEAEKQTRLVF